MLCNGCAQRTSSTVFRAYYRLFGRPNLRRVQLTVDSTQLPYAHEVQSEADIKLVGNMSVYRCPLVSMVELVSCTGLYVVKLVFGVLRRARMCAEWTVGR